MGENSSLFVTINNSPSHSQSVKYFVLYTFFEPNKIKLIWINKAKCHEERCRSYRGKKRCTDPARWRAGWCFRITLRVAVWLKKRGRDRGTILFICWKWWEWLEAVWCHRVCTILEWCIRAGQCCALWTGVSMCWWCTLRGSLMLI